MNDTTQMILAAALELGLPAVLAITALLWPRIRLWAVVVLGAVTPLLLSYAATTARFLMHQEEAQWAFDGMWMSSLVPFLACVALGAALGFSPVPKGKSARFILGLVPPAVLAVVWALGVRWMAGPG